MSRDKNKSADVQGLRTEDKKKNKSNVTRLREQSQLIHDLGIHQTELEMQNEQLRQIQEELKLSRTRYSDLYDFAPVGYFVLDKNGIVVEANLTATALVGIERKPLLGRHFGPRICKADRDAFYMLRQQVFESGTCQRRELSLLRGDGSEFPAELLVDPVKDAKDNVIQCRIAAIDITKRKAAEEALRQSEERFKALAEAMPQIVWTADADGGIEWFNRRWYEYTGQPKGIGEGWSWDKVSHPDDMAHTLKKWQDALRRGELFQNEIRVRGRDGQYHWFLVRAWPMKDDDGKVNQWFGTNTDIDELKQAQNALQQQKESYQTLAENLPGLVYRVHLHNHHMEFLNQSLFALTGYTEADLTMGEVCSFEPLIVAEDRAEVVAEVRRAVKEHRPFGLEYRLRTKTGDLRYFSERGRPVYAPDGTCTHLDGVIFDITERKRAEEALRLSNERLVMAQKSAGAGVWDWDMLEDKLNWTPELFRLFGLDPAKDEATFDSWRAVLHPEDRGLAEERIKQAIETHTSLENEYRVILPPGENRWINSLGNAAYDQNGRAVRMTGICIDITERRKRQDELSQLNRTLRALGNSAQAMMHAENEAQYLKEVCGIVVKDCGHKMVWIGFAEEDEKKSVRPAAWSGFEKGYMEKLQITWADTERGRGPTGTAIRTAKPYICKNMLTDPNFEPWRAEAVKRGYASSAVFPLIQDGKAFGAINIYSTESDPFSDDEIKLLTELASDLSYGITSIRTRIEKEVAQEELQKERDFSTAVLDTAGALVVVLDKKGKIQTFNRACEQTTGYSASQAIGRTLWEFLIQSEEMPEVKKTWKSLLAGEFPNSYENNWVAKDGSRRLIAWSNTALVDSKGRVDYVIATGIDITEQKKSQDALQESELRYRKLFEEDLTGDFISSPEGEILFCNPAYAKIFGFKNVQDAIGTNQTILHPTPESWTDFIELVKKRKILERYECKRRRRDGAVIHVVENIVGTFDEKGELTQLKGYSFDDTQRKQMEAKLENAARFPAENPFPVLRISADGTILYCNNPGVTILEQWNLQVGRKAPGDWCKWTATALKSGRYVVKEIMCDHKIFSIAITPVSDGGYVNLYGRDITRQREYEKQLRKSRDELEQRVRERTAQLVETISALEEEVDQRLAAELATGAERQRFDDVLETLPVYVCLLAPDYRVPFANHVFRDSFGYSSEEKCYEFLFNRTEPCEVCETFKVLKDNQPHHWEWTGPNGRDYDIYDFPFKDTDGSQLILEMGIDITERKKAEDHLRVTNALHELFVQKASRTEYLDSVVERICDWSGCKCVGIRLTNGDGFIPFESWTGFSNEFLAQENMLNLETDACLCVRAISQERQSQDIPLATPRGSFRSDNALEFINKLSPKDKSLYRGTCIKHGFKSLAVIPIRYRDSILGAVHIADENPNMVPLEKVELLESMAMLIGEAVHRFDVEQSLRLSESRLSQAQRIARLGNWEWEIETGALWWSDQVYRIFGLEPQESGTTYEAFLSFVHPDDRAFVQDSVNKALHDIERYDIDHRVIRPDGSECIVHEHAEVIYDANHKPLRMAGTVLDVTEQKEAEKQVIENQKELRVMAAELQLTEERERRQIAQDLHDSIGQILAFSTMALKALEKTAPKEITDSLKEVSNQLDAAIHQARSLSFDLSPSVLYDFGLETAIEDLVDRFSAERKILCSFTNCSLDKPLADDVKVLLYRCVRELLINAAKHAKADSVKVSCQRLDSDICITVEDDGRGFDVSAKDNRLEKTKGFGILSIRERLNHIGGQFKIDSAVGKGTKAILTAPLELEQNGKE